LNRTSSSAQQVKILRINLQTLFSEAAVLPLVFRRGSSRAFCLVPWRCCWSRIRTPSC
jgi:hypothetical protein